MPYFAASLGLHELILPREKLICFILPVVFGTNNDLDFGLPDGAGKYFFTLIYLDLLCLTRTNRGHR